jgi:hypothetical protein
MRQCIRPRAAVRWVENELPTSRLSLNQLSKPHIRNNIGSANHHIVAPLPFHDSQGESQR